MTTKPCVVKVESTAAWLEHPAFAVKLDLSGELQIAEWVNRLTGKTLRGGGSELRCQLDAALHRIDLPGWRQSETGEASSHPDQDWGYTERYFDPFCDDSSWSVAGSLVGYTHLIPTVFQSQRETEAAANRYQWVRSHFILPEEASGHPITLTLGGYSLGDFDYMRVFLNGAPIGIREVSGLFRKPGVFAIDPATAAYKTLRFGQDNVLALQLKDFFSRPEELDRRDRYRSFTRNCSGIQAPRIVREFRRTTTQDDNAGTTFSSCSVVVPRRLAPIAVETNLKSLGTPWPGCLWCG